MMKNIFVSLVLALISASAYAGNSEGVYLAIDVGSLNLRNSNPGGNDFSNPNIIRVAAGGHVNSLLGFEIGEITQDSDSINSDSRTATAVGGTATMNVRIKPAQAVFTFPVSESFDVFGKVGIAFVFSSLKGTGALAKLDTSSSSINATYGIGVQFNVTEDIAIRGQYEDFGKTENTNAMGAFWNVGLTLTSLGFVYTF